MNYERAWNTLKAESGYRFSEAMHEKGITLLSLMERMEDRILEEAAQAKSTATTVLKFRIMYASGRYKEKLVSVLALKSMLAPLFLGNDVEVSVVSEAAHEESPSTLNDNGSTPLCKYDMGDCGNLGLACRTCVPMDFKVGGH